MPGVHSRFSAQTAEISKLADAVGTIKNNMNNMETGIENSIHRAFTTTIKTMANHLQTLVSSIEPGNIEKGRKVSELQGGEEEETTNTQKGNHSIVVDFTKVKHNIKLKHMSLQSIYDEWYGLEAFEGYPIEGGIEALEKKYKNKWRDHFQNGQRIQFGRTKAIVMAINNCATATNVSISTVIDELQPIYVGECKSSVAKMCDYVKKEKMVGKGKARGKSAISS